MVLAVPRETWPGERRVAATPDTVTRLVGMGFEVRVEADAGLKAAFTNDEYAKAGATLVGEPNALWSEADVLLKVQPPSQDEVDRLKPGAVLISFLWPGKNSALVERLAARKVTAIAIDQVPRITRAQKMDALSSMANIAGYRAVIEAASFYGRFFTGQMTAAGRVPPAKVLVIGAGVAGLAAIGAARGLGAIVRAFDTRAAVKDQVKSMGAEFLEVDVDEEGEGGGGYAKEMSPAFINAEMALFAAQAREVDIIITTALIPNRPAPVLITEEMVQSMKRGSVIVDLAAENGGNCALTAARPGGRAPRRHHHRLHRPAEPAGADRQPALRQQPRPPARPTWAARSTSHVDRRRRGRARRAGAARRRADVAAAEDGGAAPPPAKPAAAPAKAAAGHGHGHGHAGAPASGTAQAVSALVAALLLIGLGLVAPADVPVAPHRLRAGLLRRLAGGLERHAGAAHAADERDQRDQRHHRGRRHAAGRRAAGDRC